MAVVELLLVRHGESTANVAAAEAEVTGSEVIDAGQRDADVPLSPLGVEQAEALGPVVRAWAAEPGRATVWSSPYVRARQTAETAVGVAAVELPVLVDERLRDRELGVLDLLTTHGVAVRFPEEAERRRWLGKFYHRPAGGESWADLILRVRSFLSDLERVSESERVLVVCHDALVLSFRYVCERLSEQEILHIGATEPVRNVSVTRLVRDPGELGWTLAGFNDVTHLDRQDVSVTRHPGERDPGPESGVAPEESNHAR